MSILKKIALGIVILILVLVVIEVVNASKYKMKVNVVDGENVMGINPMTESLDFGDLSRNNGMRRFITLNNGGRFANYILVWKFGEISDLVKVDKKVFVLGSGEEVQLTFDINIPPSAETKKYSGRVWIFRIPKLF